MATTVSLPWGSNSKRRQQPVEKYLLQGSNDFAPISQDNPEASHSCYHCGRFMIDIETALKVKRNVLFSGDSPRGVWIDFEVSLKDLEDAENKGCLFSKWLCYQFEDANLSRKGSTWHHHIPSDKADYLLLSMEANFRGLSDVWFISQFILRGPGTERKNCIPIRADFYVQSHHADPASRFISTRPINYYPDSSANYNLIRTWLSSCLYSQVSFPCHEPPFMPTRLLQIEQKQSRFKLTIHPTARSPYAPYAALSYCWGGDQPHKTTKYRLNQGNLAVSWSQLPKSIRDGVKVTAELSLKYLWVDSICIVQDDPDDLVNELAQMWQIYNKATVTIAASRAKSVHDGFLQARKVNIDPGVSYGLPCLFKLPFKCPSGELGSLHLVRYQKTTGESREPLDCRAWAFQERLLSPRILDYNSRRVTWICPHSNCQNGRSDGWITTNLGPRNENVRITHESVMSWTEIVWSYTSRQLTMDSDRPLAISSVAELLHGRIRSPYIFGLWKSSFATDLLWHTLGEKASPPRVKYQGPSWSWASINGPVCFETPPADKTKIMTELIDYNINLVSRSMPYGAVTAGTIRIRGRLCPGTVQSRPGPKTLAQDPQVKLIGLSKYHLPYTARFFNDASYYEIDRDQKLLKGNQKLASYIEIHPEIFAGDLILVYLLEVLKWKDWGHERTYGLVLREMVQSDASMLRRFRRIGIFELKGFSNLHMMQGGHMGEVYAELSHWFDDHCEEAEVIEIV